MNVLMCFYFFIFPGNYTNVVTRMCMYIANFKTLFDASKRRHKLW